MKTNIENKEKGLTLEEFKTLWDEKKQMNNKYGWEYNIIELRGIGNFIRVDEYLPLGKEKISIYYKGFSLGELKLSIIKSIL